MRGFPAFGGGAQGAWGRKPNPLAIETDNAQAIVSYYRNNKGLLLTMLNVSADPQQATLRGNVERIIQAYPDAKVYLYDPLTDGTSEWSFGASTSLEPYMTKMVLVSADEKAWQ